MTRTFEFRRVLPCYYHLLKAVSKGNHLTGETRVYNVTSEI